MRVCFAVGRRLGDWGWAARGDMIMKSGLRGSVGEDVLCWMGQVEWQCLAKLCGQHCPNRKIAGQPMANFALATICCQTQSRARNTCDIVLCVRAVRELFADCARTVRVSSVGWFDPGLKVA